jgi:(p)ppGpp synthase/HD superfamily hydrolase
MMVSKENSMSKSSGPAKRENSLRSWLDGKEFYKALKAMDFAKSYHNGIRKDGVTPEFDHQVQIALFIRTIHRNLLDIEDILCAVFLHDVREDFGVEDIVIRSMFGDKIADAVERLTKKFRGILKDRKTYFAEIAKCPIASVVKGCDRIHNVQSMVGVFTIEKQRSYLSEVVDFFLPMLKIARKKFPEQGMAYHNIRHMLRSQIELVEAIHAAAA